MIIVELKCRIICSHTPSGNTTAATATDARLFVSGDFTFSSSKGWQQIIFSSPVLQQYELLCFSVPFLMLYISTFSFPWAQRSYGTSYKQKDKRKYFSWLRLVLCGRPDPAITLTVEAAFNAGVRKPQSGPITSWEKTVIITVTWLKPQFMAACSRKDNKHATVGEDWIQLFLQVRTFT